MSTESIRTQLQSYRKRVDEVDDTVTAEMDRWGVPVLRVAIAVVFVWFGALKVFGISPAGELVAATVYVVDPEDVPSRTAAAAILRY